MQTASEKLISGLLQVISEQKKVSVLFSNSDFIVQFRHMLHVIRHKINTGVNDGIGMDLALVFLQNSFFNNSLNGANFTPYFLTKANRRLKVYLVGGKADVLKKAVSYTEKSFGHEVVGFCDGYDELKFHPNIDNEINQSNAEVVLVALGNPLQEKWILSHRESINASVMMGVGDLFNIWALDKSHSRICLKSKA